GLGNAIAPSGSSAEIWRYRTGFDREAVRRHGGPGHEHSPTAVGMIAMLSRLLRPQDLEGLDSGGVATDNGQYRQVCILPGTKRGVTPSQPTSFKAASRATSAASGLPWITAVMMAPSTRMATAGATFAALPTDSSTNPRRNSPKRCLCPRTNSVPGWAGSASS